MSLMAFVTASATVSGLAAGVGTMPMKVPCWPLKLTLVSTLSGPSSTSATSRRRTTWSPLERIGRVPKVSGVWNVVCISSW
jgi:hypothetical protein